MRYTTCASLEEHKKHSPNGQGALTPLANAFKKGLLFGAAGAAVGALFGGVGALVIGWLAFNYAFVEGFCDQWLNWRLICIQADTCAMGRVAKIETGSRNLVWIWTHRFTNWLRLKAWSLWP